VIRLFEALRRPGCKGGYSAVRRYTWAWSQQHASETTADFVMLSFASGEACRFELNR
jgi:hypothetical protein